MKNEFLQRTLPSLFFMLLAGVLADGVVDRIVFHDWIEFHFCAMVVVLQGMRRGGSTGLMCGWVCGLMLAAVTGEHLGLSMFSLGTVGFLAGNFQRVTILGLPALDMGLLAGLVFLERLLANITGNVLLGGQLELGVSGIIVSIVVGGCLLVIRPPAVDMKQRMMADAVNPALSGVRSYEREA